MVHIDLLGGEAGAEFGEAGSFERLASDDVVDAAEGGAELPWRGCFEAGEEGESILEILQPFFLLRRGVSLAGELVDHRLDFILTAGERVELGLREDEGFVGPAGRHDFANERDLQIAPGGHCAVRVARHPLLNRVDEVEVAVHFLILDEGAAEDDLWD